MLNARHPLILASQSASRKAMLEKVGLDFKCEPVAIDEDSITVKLRSAGKKAPDIASALAQQKALAVAAKFPDHWVIGGDQMLEIEGELLTKAKDIEDAKGKLRRLRGKTHHLICGVCIAENSKIIWSHVDTAQLTMHDFDDAMLDDYCKNAGEGLTRSVGAYEIEGAGAWLFERVEGDYFTIMGLPLLPLLGFLHHG